jgi:hypothetical protein
VGRNVLEALEKSRIIRKFSLLCEAHTTYNHISCKVSELHSSTMLMKLKNNPQSIIQSARG